MTKPVKRIDLSRFTPEQRAALIQFLKDLKAAGPQIAETKQVARALLLELLRSPVWGITDTEPPEGGERTMWHVGAPQIIDERPKP